MCFTNLICFSVCGPIKVLKKCVRLKRTWSIIVSDMIKDYTWFQHSRCFLLILFSRQREIKQAREVTFSMPRLSKKKTLWEEVVRGNEKIKDKGWALIEGYSFFTSPSTHSPYFSTFACSFAPFTSFWKWTPAIQAWGHYKKGTRCK